MSEVTIVGLDLAKNIFQAHGADGSGRAVFRKIQQEFEHIRKRYWGQRF